MAEKKKEKARKCEHCDVSYIVDAAGIKKHAEGCNCNPKNKVVKK